MPDQLFVYETRFTLEYPVLDVDRARAYLKEDDMTKYLIQDMEYRYGKNFIINHIVSLAWDMKDNQNGFIRLTTTRELNKQMLKYISEFISGQNSDGLGEGFEQQNFACYNLNDLDGGYYCYEDDDYYDEDNYVMASFDWKTNDYKLELVSK